MSTHLITGFAGKEHITSADQGSFNAAVMGGGEFVLERGEQFRCQVISNNKVRIYDGDALMQGRHIIIDRNTYEETTHDNGTQGYKRIDLIVLTYEKNAVSSVESVKLEVIKGAPAENNPTVPEYTKGDILNSGASKNQMPLYKIPFDGLSIGEPVKLFSTVPTLEGMKADVDKKVDEKIEELEGQFEELESGLDEKIAEAGKPLSSNAEDWPLIQNYGEYSADAKTVGEEFSKINESLEEVSNSINGLSEWKKETIETFQYGRLEANYNEHLHLVIIRFYGNDYATPNSAVMVDTRFTPQNGLDAFAVMLNGSHMECTNNKVYLSFTGKTWPSAYVMFAYE